MLKIKEIRRVFIRNKPRTTFHVYELRGGAWVFDYSATISGHYIKAATVARKHCESNGVAYNAAIWEL